MFYLSGLLLLLLDLSVSCGQTTQENISAFEENFQNPDSQRRYHCDELKLMEFGKYCWVDFNNSMHNIDEESWCVMEMVERSYSELTECMDYVSVALGCFYPNHVVEQLYVRIHQEYFSSCNNEEDLSDAPPGVVLMATLLPITLIPFIVYIVVWKSSLKD